MSENIQKMFISGYDKHGNAVWSPVPDSKDKDSPVWYDVNEPDGMAVTSLIFGVLWLGGLGSLIACILGHSSIGKARRAGHKASTMAYAGMVLGWLGILVTAIVAVALVAAFSHHGPPPCDLNNPAYPYC